MGDVKTQIVNELYKPPRKNFKRRKTVVKSIGDLFQIDLADFQNLAFANRGYKYILVVIDCFSKYLWTRPLKTKSAENVTEAMQSILNDVEHKPKNLQYDQGREFLNLPFRKLMKNYNINHYHTYSIIKCAIVERVIRTLKTKLYKEFHINGSYNWLDHLQDVTNKYNDTVHRTIKMKPKNVAKKHEKKLLSTVYKRNDREYFRRNKYNLGDTVRISKYKHFFEKGYTPSWTTELFRINEINSLYPPTYLLSDLEGNPIKGCFYEEELQRTNYPNTYLVEKVIRRKGNKVFVKWLGFDKKFNSWIQKSAIV